VAASDPLAASAPHQCGRHAARLEPGGGVLRIPTHELDRAVWMFGIPARVYAVDDHRSRLDVDPQWLDDLHPPGACNESLLSILPPRGAEAG